VIKTKQNSFHEFSSASFVEAQMMRELLAALSHTFDSARRQQLAASSAEMTARQFLSDSGFDRFDFDLLFLLGGFSGTLSQISPEEAEAARVNQMAPVKATITMLHVLHKRLFEVRKNTKLKLWGINRASEEASKIRKEYRNERGQSAETFANYWENTRLSAPLLYAAALTDRSMMLEWLIGRSPYVFERMSTYMSSWFQTANRVAEEMLKPLHLLHPSWRPLQVRGSLSVLPSPVPDEKLASLLNDVLTEEQLWNRPFTGRGQIILAPDGIETYYPLES